MFCQVFMILYQELMGDTVFKMDGHEFSVKYCLPSHALGQHATSYNFHKVHILVHSEFSVPDLDLASPVAGGRSRRKDGMLRHTKAGLAVGGQDVQCASIVVIVEVGRACGAS